MIFSFFQKNGFWGILGPPSYGIGATIRIGREMLCLPYAGFFPAQFKLSSQCLIEREQQKGAEHLVQFCQRTVEIMPSLSKDLEKPLQFVVSVSSSEQQKQVGSIIKF